MIWLVLLIIEILVESIFTSLIPWSYNPFLTDLTTASKHVWISFSIWILTRFIFQFSQSFKNYIQIRYGQILRQRRTQEIGKKFAELKHLPTLPQRVQEDIKLSYQYRIQVYTEYVISFIMVCGLVGWYLHHHWILVAFALLYASVTLGLALLFRPKMILAEQITQQSEADFRLSLLDGLHLHQFFWAIKCNIRAARIRLWYQNFSVIQMILAFMLPYLFLIPKVLAHHMTIGEMFEYTQAFGLIVVNFDVLIQMFQVLTQGQASERRVNELCK